jgi:UPF0716 family protein affecting phage T7 exclusion
MRTMRTLIPYTAARILMFGIAVMILYWAGARGILLLGLGLLISAIASYILLNKQRQILADRLNSRLSGVGAKATEFRERLEDGTKAEDEDADEDEDEDDEADAAPPAATDTEADAEDEPARN